MSLICLTRKIMDSILLRRKGATYIVYFQDYLMGKTSTIRLDEIMSKERRIMPELPQASTLPPVLYDIYTSDLPREEEYTNT